MANKNVPPKILLRYSVKKHIYEQEGKGMVDTIMYARIQEKKKEGYSKRRTATELNIDKRTVGKYWEMSEETYARYMMDSKERAKSLDPYRAYIIGKLEIHKEITASIIDDNLREDYPDFAPSYRSVRLYVANLREELGLPSGAKIRQYCEVEELPMGFQAQVDMGQKSMEDVYGNKVKIYIFAMVMSCSRKKYVYFQDKPFTAEDFIKAHDLALRYYGGRTSEIVYDQDRVMTVSENAGDLILTEKFESYHRYAGFGIRLCRGHDPESKGKIEAVVKFVKNNFLKCRTYFGLSRLNSEGLAWLDRCANGRVHETTKMVPDYVFKQEIRHLKPAPELSQPVPPRIAAVRPTNVIPYLQNRYQVPKGTHFPGREARIEADETSGTVSFHDSKTGELLARHDIETNQKGRLVALPKNADRFSETKYDELKTKVIAAFCGFEPATAYIGRIMEKYPRYIRDQLSIIRKAQEKYALPALINAINYCTQRELFSATDLRDTLEYFSQDEPTASGKVVLPAKYSSVAAEERAIGDYSKIAGGPAL
jgi:transposase